MKYKDYPKDSIESWTIFYVDKGNSLSIVKASLTGIGDNRYCRVDKCPAFDETIAENTIKKMINDKILACGSGYGWDEWLVVDEFMPKTAQALREEAMFECCMCKKDCESIKPICFDCSQNKISVFPVGTDNKQGRLYENIIDIFLDYINNEKYPDVNTRRYAMKVLDLFDKFVKPEEKDNE